METKYFSLAYELNEGYKQLLLKNEAHYRASLNSFSLISVSQEKPELGIPCKKNKYKLAEKFSESVSSDLSEIKNKPNSTLSKPEKKLQAWIINNAIQNNYKLPFDNDIKFITSELAIPNKEGKKIVTDILGYSESKKQLCVIELKSDRLLKRLIEQVNNFENVIKENPEFFKKLLLIHGYSNTENISRSILKIVVWPHEKTSPKKELKDLDILEFTYQDQYSFIGFN